MGYPYQEALTEWGQYPFPPDIRNLAMETMYEYGSRVGVWRILDILKRHDVKSTFFPCAVASRPAPGLADPRHLQAPRRQEHVLRLRGRVRARPRRRARSGGARTRDLQPRLPVGGSLPVERGRGARAHPTRGRVV